MSIAQIIETAHQQGVREERMRITQDLHDGLGSQIISALALFQNGQIGSSEIEECLNSCMDEIRTIIDSHSATEANPSIAIADLCHRMRPRLEHAGIELHWVADVQDNPCRPMNPQQTLNLVRITQEALANVLKYSRATRAEVRLTVTPSLRLSISDNGRGMRTTLLSEGNGRTTGLGLASMKNRAAKINGVLSMQSNSSGTRIEVTAA